MSKRPRSPESEDSLEGGGEDLFPSTTESSEASGDEAEAEAVRERLLVHAKLAGNAIAEKRARTGEGDSLSHVLRSGAKSGASDALARFREELTKPVESTALAVVNATDESSDVLRRLVRAKVPPASASDAKKLRSLGYVDHSKIDYPPIRKDFYVVPPDMKNLTSEELKELYKELDGAKVRSGRQPRPLTRWDGTGLSPPVLKVLAAKGYAAPFAVQSLGIPALMSGSDLLITAKTGSGKTLCYVLPMVRHCMAQPRSQANEGPIGLVLVPTKELAVQVFDLTNTVCVAAGIRCVPTYGSSSLAENISALKAGCEVVVATPGRLLDMLTVNNGKVMSLQRVSFVVVDEADRLFDSGFMEHVVAFLRNVRPDRQVAMISATLPKELKRVVLKQMHDPVEIAVGGKAAPASNVKQFFYFFDKGIFKGDESESQRDPRFVKLLQVLGEECYTGEKLALVFTQRKEEVDELFAKLSVNGYNRRVATLYSGMDPIDREAALEHFQPGKQFILISTGVAERGLDIPFLELVVNYYLPDHYEAFVHRIGRTGRAGRPGKAVSFFTRDKDEDIAPELVEGLERAGQEVPEELYNIANLVVQRRKEGSAYYNAGFFRGYGKAKKQRFMERDKKEQMRAAAKASGLDAYLSSSDSDSARVASSSSDDDDDDIHVVAVDGKRGGARSTEGSSTALTLHGFSTSNALVRASQQQRAAEDRVATALEYARRTTEVATAEAGGSGSGGKSSSTFFESEYEINNLPTIVRHAIQKTAFIRSTAEDTETSIVTKGTYCDPRFKHSHRLEEGDRPLYLLVKGKTPEAVREAVSRLNEEKKRAMQRIKGSSSIGTL